MVLRVEGKTTLVKPAFRNAFVPISVIPSGITISRKFVELNALFGITVIAAGQGFGKEVRPEAPNTP
jgi:hypothetical protein